MRATFILALIGAALFAPRADAWSNHALVAYWAFRNAPDVAQAPDVAAEPLEAFLKDQEQAIETLLAAQESWARANIAAYPPRPDELAFKAAPARDDALRRKAFVEALRIAADTKFALYAQQQPGEKPAPERALKFSDVSTLPEPPLAFYRFARLDAGEKIAPLAVVSSASTEPDLGTDINCWDDSPSTWGPRYKFGKLPFGNPALNIATQAPFHMGFFHQSWLIYKAAPFVARTYPLLRIKQFSGLAELAFRTGHPYWGWRFAGNALHYVQDLTQPYHASLLPGASTARMIYTNLVAILGFPRAKNDLIVLVSNRHFALERYQIQILHRAMSQGASSPVLEALQSPARDGAYPPWSDFYARDVAAAESAALGERMNAALLAAAPSGFVSDPAFDFGASGGHVDLMRQLDEGDPAKRATLDAAVAEALAHFGAHSRNLLKALVPAR